MKSIITYAIIIFGGFGLFLSSITASLAANQAAAAAVPPTVSLGLMFAGILVTSALPALQKVLSSLPDDAKKAAKKAGGGAAGLLLVVGIAATQSGCPLGPVSPETEHVVLDVEQSLCVLAADFVAPSDAATVLQFCGWAKPITQVVIGEYNTLVGMRGKVAVDIDRKTALKQRYYASRPVDAAAGAGQ